MHMKISISGCALALDRATNAVITDPRILRTLNGVASTEEISAYFTDELADLGIIGGKLQLIYEEKTGILQTMKRVLGGSSQGTTSLRVLSEFWAPQRLSEADLERLVEDTRGQWSDGIGEGPWYETALPDPQVWIDVSPSNVDQELRVEQIEDGRRVPSLSLWKAAQAGDVEAIKKALADGEDVNISWQGFNALHMALRHGRTDAALLLIARGADVSASDIVKRTPLMACAASRDLNDADSVMIALALIAAGADVKFEDLDGGVDEKERGATALYWAKRENKQLLANVLIERGADPTRIMYAD